MKHLFLKYNQECSFEAFPEPEIRNTREVWLLIGGYMSPKEGTEYDPIHIHNICQKAFSENPDYAGRKTQPATSLNVLAKSAKKIYRLGLQ